MEMAKLKNTAYTLDKDTYEKEKYFANDKLAIELALAFN